MVRVTRMLSINILITFLSVLPSYIDITFYYIVYLCTLESKAGKSWLLCVLRDITARY